jgi:hypothetical protein
MRRAAVVAVVATLACARAQAQADDVAALVAKATQYVEDYERKFSAVVCEERQSQRILKDGGKVDRQRALVSDLLLIKVEHETQTFRDVMEVDGKPVRDRQERLEQLFLNGSRPNSLQMLAIAEESARYNIGVRRGLDTLMLPLTILHADAATGFHFTRADAGLAFDEFRSPSLVQYYDNGRPTDLMMRGMLTIDGEGRVSGAHLVADNPQFGLTVDVTYAQDASSGLLVPVASRERYQPPKAKEWLEVASTYANFRRFQVSVEELIAKPKR